MMNDLRIVLQNKYSKPIEDTKKVKSSREGKSASAANPGNGSDKADEINLSDRGKILSLLAAVPEIRYTKIDEVREKVSSGSYLSDEKIKSALKKLIQDL